MEREGTCTIVIELTAKAEFSLRYPVSLTIRSFFCASVHYQMNPIVVCISLTHRSLRVLFTSDIEKPEHLEIYSRISVRCEVGRGASNVEVGAVIGTIV